MAAPRSPPHSVPTTPPTNNTATAPEDQFSQRPLAYDVIPYSASFTNALQAHFLDTSLSSGSTSTRNSIRLLPNHSEAPFRIYPEASSPRQTISVSAIDMRNIPSIELSDMPLPLDDPRRVYVGPVPGVFLTHPGGFIEGGPSTDTLLPTSIQVLRDQGSGTSITSDTDLNHFGQQVQPISLANRPTSPPHTTTDPASPLTNRPAEPVSPPPFSSVPTPRPNSAYTAFVRAFLSRHPSITTQADLQRAITAETEAELDILRTRMREREEVVRRNEKVDGKIEALVKEREFEREVMEKWKKRRSGGKDEREGAGRMVAAV